MATLVVDREAQLADHPLVVAIEHFRVFGQAADEIDVVHRGSFVRCPAVVAGGCPR
jgi:hypothetical protein